LLSLDQRQFKIQPTFAQHVENRIRWTVYCHLPKSLVKYFLCSTFSLTMFDLIPLPVQQKNTSNTVMSLYAHQQLGKHRKHATDFMTTDKILSHKQLYSVGHLKSFDTIYYWETWHLLNRTSCYSISSERPHRHHF